MRGESKSVINDEQDGEKSMDDSTIAYSIVQYKKSPSGSEASKQQEKGKADGGVQERAGDHARSKAAVALMVHDGAARAKGLKQN